MYRLSCSLIMFITHLFTLIYSGHDHCILAPIHRLSWKGYHLNKFKLFIFSSTQTHSKNTIALPRNAQKYADQKFHRTISLYCIYFINLLWKSFPYLCHQQVHTSSNHENKWYPPVSLQLLNDPITNKVIPIGQNMSSSLKLYFSHKIIAVTRINPIEAQHLPLIIFLREYRQR